MTAQLGTRPSIRGVARSGLGQPVRGAGIVVTDRATGQPATVYSDEALTLPVVSPTADSMGVYGFYVAPGTYGISFTGGTSFQPAEDVLVVGGAGPGGGGGGS